MDLEVRILGPLEVVTTTASVAVGGAKERGLFVLLALDAGRMVSTERLLEELWSGLPPASGSRSIRVLVSRLRKALEGAGAPDAIVTRPPGYLLSPDVVVDAAVFEAEVARGRGQLADGHPVEAADTLRQALSLWRAPHLADVPGETARLAGERLGQIRLTALQIRVEADLACGRHAEVLGELQSLTALFPLQEQFWAARMVALYRAGRQADALRAYQELRNVLLDDLGIDPSPELRRLEAALLAQDPSLSLDTAPVGRRTGETAATAPDAARAPTWPDRSKNNLPVPVSRFVGRASELVELHRLLSAGRLVTVTGMGGAGKSRLTLQAARELVGGFDDGVWLVELAPVADQDLVPSAIASALGVREEPDRPIGDTLAQVLANQDLLIVLDNCEHVIDASAKLVESLLRGCPRLRVVATSREALGVPGEQVYRIPPMSLPPSDPLEPEALGDSEAVELFVDRARLQQPTFALDRSNMATVSAVCRQLDGIPLAIELAAGRLGSLSVTSLLSHLDDRFRLLAGGARTAVPRQKTLRAAVDWSFDLLTEPERIILSRLSVFSGGFDPGTAEAILTPGQSDPIFVLDVVSSLVGKSLIEADRAGDGVRYRLLETIRQYSAERLAEQGAEERDRVHEAHGLAFLHLAEESVVGLPGPDQAAWLSHLEEEHGNLRAAMAHFLTVDDGGATALRMALAMSLFWRILGHFAEGIDALETAVAKAGDQHPRLRCRALVAVGKLYGRRGAYPPARRAFNEGLEQARLLGEAAVAADALGEIAYLETREGTYAEALVHANEAVSLARAGLDPVILADTLDVRATALNLAEHPGPRRDWEEALGLAREAANPRLEAMVLNNLTAIDMKEGRLADARVHLKEALVVARATHSDNLAATVLGNLGLVDVLDGNYSAAEHWYRESFEVARHADDLQDLAWAVFGLALCASQAGKFDRAAALHGASDALREQLGDALDTTESGLRARDLERLGEGLGANVLAARYEVGHDLSPAGICALVEQEHRPL